MHPGCLIIVGILFTSFTYCALTTTQYDEFYHPSYGTVDNPNVSLEDDCALRAFVVEMAGYIAPAAWKANWTALSQSALQMEQCNTTLYSMYQSNKSTKQFQTAQEIKQKTCHRKVFVHDSIGNDMFDGTFEKPMKTIQAALSHTRNMYYRWQ